MTMKLATINKQGRRSSSALFALVGILLSFGSNPALSAKPLTAAQVQVYESANEGQRVHFLIERAQMGQIELVQTLMQNYPLQGPHVKNRTLYIEGLILESQGDLTGAAEKYRAALANDPSLTLIRNQLAKTLATLGQDDSAKHHLQLLEAEAPNSEIADGIRAFIDRIDSKRPVTFSGFVSIAPSTNMNSGSSHAQVYSANPVFGGGGGYLDINAANQVQSGIGLVSGASIGYAKRLGNHWQAVFAGDITAQIYADKKFDAVSLSQSAEMRYHHNNGYLGFGGVADQAINPNAANLIDDSLTYHSYGPRVSAMQYFGAHDVLHASAVYEWRDYANSTSLDGTAFLGDASFNHGFNSTFNVTVSGGYNKVSSALDFISYDTYYAGFGFYKELPKGITVNANAQARFSSFDAMHPVFFTTREDQRYIGSVALTKRDLNFMGFAPSMAYTYTRNVSNIAAYDYDAHAIDLRLTKDF